MAKFLISYFSTSGEVMYDAIASELLRNGNDVFRLNINRPSVVIDRSGVSLAVDKALMQEIQDFSPEIILNFNNTFPSNIGISKNCKNCVIDADNPEYFLNKSQLKASFNECYFLGLQSFSNKLYADFLGVDNADIKYLPFLGATLIVAEELPRDKNITFIGSNFYPSRPSDVRGFYDKIGLELYDKFNEDYFYSIESAKTLIGDLPLDAVALCTSVRDTHVGQERVKYMQVVSDLGFTFYGTEDWPRIAAYDFALAKCFDKTKIHSLAENQWVYNTSKISINISHPQAKSAFSWRVMDIMASSACVLIESKPDWFTLFGEYVSKEVQDAIIYNNQYDMRDKAIRLLQDEELRLRCVRECNAAIETNGRWIHRFEKLERFLGLPIVNLETLEPKYIFKKREVLKPGKLSDSFGSFKSRAKIVFYSLMLILAQLPLISILFSTKLQDRYLAKLQKNWR